ncbi:hypothetical protein BMH25_14665 [Leucobacter sp. OLCALW19]|nr:hypothetical protein BMH25_14665 [Leucobacter sp. OLCALW19]
MYSSSTRTPMWMHSSAQWPPWATPPTTSPAANVVPGSSVDSTGSIESTVRSSILMESTGRSTTTPAKATVPRAGARTGSPGSAGTSIPRCPDA